MACLCQRAARRINSSARQFSTSARCNNSLQLGLNDREQVASAVPAYPYGPAQWYKQSDLGLYGGQKIMFGNNTSEKYQTRKRRSWGLNVKTKRLWSNALNEFVQIRVTTRVLRTIDKLGGLDEYLLGEKEQRIKDLGETGWWLRWAVMQTPAVRQRFDKERQNYGLIESTPEVPAESVEVKEIEDSAKKAKEGLRFRVGSRHYLQYINGSWRSRKAVIGKLSFLLWKHSPSQAIKRWEATGQRAANRRVRKAQQAIKRWEEKQKRKSEARMSRLAAEGRENGNDSSAEGGRPSFEGRRTAFFARKSRNGGSVGRANPSLERRQRAFFANEKRKTQEIRAEIRKLGETALESPRVRETFSQKTKTLEWKSLRKGSYRARRAKHRKAKKAARAKEAGDSSLSLPEE